MVVLDRLITELYKKYQLEIVKPEVGYIIEKYETACEKYAKQKCEAKKSRTRNKKIKFDKQPVYGLTFDLVGKRNKLLEQRKELKIDSSCGAEDSVMTSKTMNSNALGGALAIDSGRPSLQWTWFDQLNWDMDRKYENFGQNTDVNQQVESQIPGEENRKKAASEMPSAQLQSILAKLAASSQSIVDEEFDYA